MIVGGEGALSAKIWLIGEAPGAQEDRSGVPFSGSSGFLLNDMLAEVGILRRDCYVDNVIQEKPDSNDFSVFYEDSRLMRPKPVLQAAHQRLFNLVRENRPNVVVALGNEAMFALTGHKMITKWRGSILSCGGVKVIPTIHPAMVLRQYEFRPMCIIDLAKAKKESLSPEFPVRAPDHFLTNPTFEQVIETIKKLHKEKWVSFDIETVANQIDCIGLAWSSTEAICIPIFHGSRNFWSPDEEAAIIKELRELFASRSVGFIAQNATFDMTYLRNLWHIEVPNLVMDTMLAHHCVYPELPKSLAFQTTLYTTRNFYKDMASEGMFERWTYNCLDCCCTFEAATAIEQELKEFGTYDFYMKHSHPLIMPLFNIQQQGIKIDLAKRDELDKSLSKQLEELQEKLDKAVGHSLNVQSPKQVKDYLYNELKLPERIKRGTGNVTADEDAINDLYRLYPNEALKLILELRGIKKLLQTYVRVQLDPDNRIRCSYVLTGTETGRLSSRESITGSGTNLQNIPREDTIRSLFVPDEGFQFVNCDLSQAEARVVASLCNDERMQGIFTSGDDIHKRNASLIFHKHISQVDDRERQLAKSLVHAANYGIGKRKFARVAGILESHAAQLLNQYYATYPGIKRWHMDVEDQLRRTRILETPFGRKRHFFGRFDQEMVRSGLAFIPQSTVSDLINLGLVKAYHALPRGWTICMQVHDSLLFQVPADAEPIHIWKFMKHYLENEILIGYKTLLIPIDIKIGKNWGNLEKLKWQDNASIG